MTDDVKFAIYCISLFGGCLVAAVTWHANGSLALGVILGCLFSIISVLVLYKDK